jgi:alpha,alpha-trehalase
MSSDWAGRRVAIADRADPTTPEPAVLRNYALLADGERGALIGPRGDIVWMCAPGWDSGAIFSSLIGGNGFYTVMPSDPWFVWGGHYEEGSLIWRSRWMTSTGAIECREALTFPGDPHTAVLLRRIKAVDRPAEVRVLLDPRAEYGRHQLRDLRRDGEIWTGRTGPLHVRWSGGADAREADGRLVLDLEVSAGDTHDLVLEISGERLPDEPVGPGWAWSATEERWRREMPELGTVIAERDARHAYAVLRGLTSASGGMVAAATTSLPERAESGRDYDYRFAWVRDQSYAGQAVAATGAYRLLDNAVDFVSARVLADGPKLRPAYTVDGGRVPAVEELAHLIGYPGGGSKVGNRIDKQFQLDVFGEALLLFSAAARHDRLDTGHWRAVEATVDAIEQRWNEPGAGVWETQNQRWTHSRLICAAGLRTIADAGTPTAQAAAWNAFADRIVAETSRESLHPTGRWQRAPGDPRVDASLLLPALRGALPPGDPRSAATLDAVRTELSEDGYIYRYRHDQRPLHEAEGSFLLCGFATAMAAHQQGDVADGRAWFERSRAACGPPGLYSEEYDVRQRQLRGNLPQAFVHAFMMEAASRLSQPGSTTSG